MHGFVFFLLRVHFQITISFGIKRIVFKKNHIFKECYFSIPKKFQISQFETAKCKSKNCEDHNMKSGEIPTQSVEKS